MAIYHCSCKIISRSSGRSAVGASAYRSGEKLENERDGIVHDYTRKRGIEHSEIMLPENAPKEWQDRSKLWNEVEKIEKASDSQLSREYEVALPIELTMEQNKKLAREICDKLRQDGMCVDYSIHTGHSHKSSKEFSNDGEIKKDNPHVHIMCTMRPLDENGKWENKREKLYLCKNVKGEERAFTKDELARSENAEWQKQYHYSKNGNPKGKKIYLTEYEKQNNPKYAEYERIKGDKYPKSEKYGKLNPQIEKWNSQEYLLEIRKTVADKINMSLERYGHKARVDHRSYKEQGIDKIPTIHEGGARKMESRGIETDRGNINREIKKANGQMQTIEILEKQTQKEIAFIREDISWNKHHEEIAKLEKQIPKAAGNEKVLLSLQAGLLKLYDKAKLIEPTKTSEGRKIEIDEISKRQAPYFEYHKNKLLSDISFLQDKVKGYLETLEQKQEHGGFAARREEFKRQEVPQEKPQIDTAYTEKMARELATLRNEYVRETVKSHERTSYQPNPIYERQANEIESLAKTVTEQSRTIEAFKAERDKLGMFKGKEKKEIQGKIDNFEKLRSSNLDKLKALGVSELSKADEAVREKRTLAAQERAKVQAARQNVGAESRAEEAKQVFLEVAKQIPADQRQAVLERMEQYKDVPEAGGMEVFKTEIEARRVLDSTLKEHTQSREREKVKEKGRGRGE
uniref:MobA/MobL protein domain-containing protein n=1 Tax=uncultured prokaryote TaxID=198431 RepID=A0A0H5QF63_9ZZZZ|nr:hypothetical protein [uncultured prokaryote]